MKLNKINEVKRLSEISKDSLVAMEISEDQMRKIRSLENERTEIVMMLEQRLREMILMIHPNDLTSKFDTSATLFEATYRIVKEIEKKTFGNKGQNYETQNCKAFNQQFDQLEKSVVAVTETNNRAEFSFIFDINKVL